MEVVSTQPTYYIEGGDMSLITLRILVALAFLFTYTAYPMAGFAKPGGPVGRQCDDNRAASQYRPFHGEFAQSQTGV